MSANQARAIFIELVANVPPEQWEGRLAELAGEDQDLRRKVKELLAAHHQAGSFLEHPAVPLRGTVDLAAEDGGAEPPGTLLAGRYKLLEAIGEGGMGAVWMAQQTEPVKRLVAVKLIKPGMDSKQVLARFEAERQALALMDHPHIAKVHDAGVAPDGRPFFVMELVKGVPITRYCDELRLTPRQRLELFVPVCQAIQHAHQKGVIHRDVKPSNVLVARYDDRPVPKVIDFGVAKATGQSLTEQTLHTGFGAVVGTIEYMSPEQASFNQLDVDTRSDVYSLGVLLYELLAGSPPFGRKELEKAGMLEMLRVIREQEPSKPSTKLSTAEGLPALAANRGTEPKRLTALVRGELDWIVMKALEKDRSRRYDTATGLALDVQRYLNDEHVQAYPPSRGYRLRKFTRRHKAGLGAVGLVGAALVAGASVSLWQAVRATRAEQRTQEELEQKTQQHARAEANFRRTLAAVDGLLLEVGEKDLAAEPHLEHIRRRLLEKALRFFEEFLHEKGDDPTTRFEAGLAYRRVGDIRALLGRNEQADGDYTRGIALLEQLNADGPGEPAYRHELGLTLHRRVVLLVHLGHGREAEQANQQARELQAALLADAPDHSDYRFGLANSHRLWATFLKRQRRYEEAVEAARRAVELLDAPAGAVADRVRHAVARVASQEVLARVFVEAGRPQEAEEAYQKAVALAEDLVRQFGERPDGPNTHGQLTQTHVNFGLFLWQTGRIPDAERAFRRSVEAARPPATKYPNVPVYQQGLSVALGNLGQFYFQTGRPREAVAVLEEAGRLYEKLASSYPAVPDYQSQLGANLSNLAMALVELDEADKARPLLERAIAQQKAALRIQEHRVYREFHCAHHVNLANVLDRLDVADAEKDRVHERAVELIRTLAHDFPDVASYQSQVGGALNNWAVLLKKRGDFPRARQLVEEALVFQKAALKGNDRNPTYLGYLRNHYDVFTEVLRALQSPDLERAYRELRAVTQQLANLFPKVPDHASDLGKIENDLGGIHLRRSEGEEARRLFDEAVGHQQTALALGGPRQEYRAYLANHYLNLGAAWRQLKRPGEAEQAYRSALAVREGLAAQFPAEPRYFGDLGSAWLALAQLRDDPVALGEAARAFRRAGRWKDVGAVSTRSIRLRDGGDAFDYLLLAMAAWHLGHKGEAGAWYGKAIAWTEKHATTLPGERAEALRRLRVEAEVLLGIVKKEP